MELFYTKLQDENWPIYIAATENGLCYVGGIEDDHEAVVQFANKNFKSVTYTHGSQFLDTVQQQLLEYLYGQRKQFSIPLDQHGTDFQKKVWKALEAVSYGEFASYQFIAQAIGQEKAVRAVGRAIGANPIAILVPCHRIIGKNKTLTGYRGGLPMKKRLLKIENIILY